MPALELDVALVHMNRADAARQRPVPRPRPLLRRPVLHGRQAPLRVVRAHRRDRSAARRGRRCTRCASTACMVDGVVEAPRGAHFTECPPDYGRDEAFQREYARRDGRRRRLAEVLDALPRARVAPSLPRGGASAMTSVTRAEICAVALAEAFRGDGEILASPIGMLPSIGARLAKLTFEPDLLLTDGVASLIGERARARRRTERRGRGLAAVPHRLRPASGRAAPRDDGRAARSTASATRTSRCIGDPRRSPRRSSSACAARRATRSTTPPATGCRTTRQRVFVAKVDVVSGVGYDRAAALGPRAARFHEHPPRGLEPRRLRLRDARPLDAPRLGAPRRDVEDVVEAPASSW